jgi:hypothetical protein
MKIKIILQIMCLSILLLASKGFSLTGGSWFPSAGGPGHITWVRYDIAQAPGELRVELKDASGTLSSYFYSFDPSNSIMLSRANAFYSALLTAQASGLGVILYILSSNSQINAVQVGN